MISLELLWGIFAGFWAGSGFVMIMVDHADGYGIKPNGPILIAVAIIYLGLVILFL